MALPAASGYETTSRTTAEERDRLILEHLPQVRLIAMRIHEKLSSQFALEDLISTGVVGLIAAVDNYDHSFNVKLKTYAEFRIRGAILDSIRHLDGIPLHKRKQVKQVSQVVNTLEQRLQRAPTEQEIAAELGMNLDEYRDFLFETRRVTIGSLDASPTGNEDLSFAGLASSGEEDLPLRQLERSELVRLLTRAIECLPPQERTVLTLYYLHERTLREIAEIMSIHLSRVAQLKTQSLIRIRGFFEKCWPSDRGIY